MKRRGILFFSLVILFFLALAVVDSEQDKVKKEVYEELGEKGEVNVIVTEKKEKVYGAKIDAKELEKLKKDKNVEEISFAPLIKAFLQDSVSIVNATYIWNLTLNNINITGIDETVCIIDTAVNFSHPDLIGTNKTCVIDCYNKSCVENCSITDDSGHGTHVAGIVAASGKINGIGKQAGLISLKVLDENGDAHPQDGVINIRDAIQWCVQNKNTYNISVISLSLGTTTLYEAYCDSSFSSTLTRAINNATSYNISVIAATGNSGSTTSIASPACIENATSVGSVRKDDSTFNYNRNNITDLIAPGYSINSTRGYSGGCLTNCQCYGEYMVCSGTSMAAPHVSGAFALVKQYLRLRDNQESKHLEIQNTLNATGRIINDPGSNLNFSRIDILSAIISLDETGPEVNLISPINAYTQFSQNATFECSANDPQLINVTLYLWNSSGIYNNTESLSFQGVNGRAEFNISNLSRDTYEWNCLAYDNSGNSSFASSNFTLKIDYNQVILNSPSNNTHTNLNQTFNCSSETETSKQLSNMTIFIWNSTDAIYNETKNISGISNSSVFYYNFTREEEYYWNCLVYNNHSESSFSISNHSLTYDLTSPNITLISPENSASYTGSQSINFVFNVSSDTIDNCSLIINEAISSTNYSVNRSITQQFTENMNPGSYTWKINCLDLAGNEKDSSSYSLTINSEPIVSSSGGGGSAVQEKTYLINQEQSSGGYNQELEKNDKIIFYIKNQEHTITTKLISLNSAVFLIESEPVEITLLVGEEKLLDLTGDSLDDLYLKLNSINSNKANLTIKTLEEKEEEKEGEEETEDVGGSEEIKEVPIVAFEEEESNLNAVRYILTVLSVLVVVVAVIAIIIIFRSKNEKIKAKSSRKEKVPSNRRKRRRQKKHR